jgi:hypothetical protein
MATLLRVTVSDLLADSADSDPILEVSKAEWWNWVRNTAGINGQVATKLRDEWLEAYELTKGAASARAKLVTEMKAEDWQHLYDQQKPSSIVGDRTYENGSLFT